MIKNISKKIYLPPCEKLSMRDQSNFWRNVSENSKSFHASFHDYKWLSFKQVEEKLNLNSTDYIAKNNTELYSTKMWRDHYCFIGGLWLATVTRDSAVMRMPVVQGLFG